ncbi:AAA family ATPase [Streptomyces sp. 549]|uniref:AAA family ATPase n=1 Tax=Streptomyces sp. 549 TaxID=3049076 RepID=UPI0024C2C268|nr:AAA family ATPase [Streptomyces sp. 549]MDK1474136.1 AAA family ATPase [Streptomyces sp. 549]
MSTDGSILVLSGPPGAGKTTVARLLASLRPAPVVHLHADDFWANIVHGAVSPYRPEADAQNATVVRVLAGAAAGYAADGYQVLVDGVIGPWFLPPIRQAAEAAGLDLHYAVLRPDEQTALDRGTARPDHPLTDPGPIRHMHRQFADLGELESHVLDSSLLDSTATVDAVLLGLADGRFRL